MKFFFDRCMPLRLARMVDVYDIEHTIRHHDDDARFNPSTPDIDWVSALAAEDPPWIVISGDGRILRNKAERRALEQANLTFFCMTKQWTHMKFHEYAWKFLRVWPSIVENADVHTPKIFEVSGGKALKVEFICLTKERG